MGTVYAFDPRRGQALKDAGMDLAASNRREALAAAREYAYQLGYYGALVTADDVAVKYPGLGPAAGSLFRGAQWVWTGEWEPSARVSNHRRFLRVWRLRDAPWMR